MNRGNCRLSNAQCEENRGFTGPTGPTGGGAGGGLLLKFSGTILPTVDDPVDAYLSDAVGFATTADAAVFTVYAGTDPINYPAMITGTAVGFSASLAAGSLNTNQTATVDVYLNGSAVVAAQLVFAFADAGTTLSATFSQAVVPTDTIDVHVTLTAADGDFPAPTTISAALLFNF